MKRNEIVSTLREEGLEVLCTELDLPKDKVKKRLHSIRKYVFNKLIEAGIDLNLAEQEVTRMIPMVKPFKSKRNEPRAIEI